MIEHNYTLDLSKKISIHCMKFQYGGGMERYVMDLVNGLYKVSIKPTVYSTKFKKNLFEYNYINPVLVNTSFIPKPLRNILLPYFFSKKEEQNSVSITTMYTLSDIVICGGNHIGYLNAIEKEISLSDKLKIRNEKRSLCNAKLIIAHSQMMQDELIKFYNIDKEKISVIYPPVDINKFSLSRSKADRLNLRKRFAFNDDEVIYLFPSTGHSRKGFALLKQYFESSDLPIRLVVAGTPVLESKNITSLGYCENMPDLYKAADYTIMASIYEPFGLVGIESILSGTPVIFSDNMGCLEVLKHNFGYKFSRNDITTLDKVIRQSVVKVQTSDCRIDNPFNCISYDPKLSTHIKNVLESF